MSSGISTDKIISLLAAILIFKEVSNNQFKKVLEIGTGSGYQTAILMEISKNVYTIALQQFIYLTAG